MRAGDRIGADPILVLAAVGYLAGLATFLASSSTILGTITDTVSSGNLDALVALLQSPGFADTLSFVVLSIDSPSPALLFLVGAVVFPFVLGVHAIRTSRTVWGVLAGFAFGPLIGLGLAVNPIIVTTAVDLLLYVLLPALAVMGTAVTLSRR